MVLMSVEPRRRANVGIDNIRANAYNRVICIILKIPWRP
jgi:hypothetical protein